MNEQEVQKFGTGNWYFKKFEIVFASGNSHTVISPRSAETQCTLVLNLCWEEMSLSG